MEKKLCDMHTHSYFSDGTASPHELIEGALDIGLSAIALTDHNTVSGCTDFLLAARGKDIEAVCGCEFSCDYENNELHLLGLFIKPSDFDKVTALTDEFLARKEESNRLLAKNLNAAGYNVDYDKIRAENSGIVNRAHIASELVRLGYVSSIKEAFKTLLSKKGSYYVEPKRLDIFKTIEFINSIGAVSVLAHPFLQFDEQGLRRFLDRACAVGLMGMETMYSTYDEETVTLSKTIAKEYSLLESGGSDFHGGRKPDISIGIGKGNLSVHECFYKKLKEHAL